MLFCSLFCFIFDVHGIFRAGPLGESTNAHLVCSKMATTRGPVISWLEASHAIGVQKILRIS